MPARYAPIPNPLTDPDAQNEMEAAFLESDDEEEDHQPLMRSNGNGYHPLANEDPHPATREGPSTYDFENVDYDAEWTRPPPGSPPPDALSFRAQGNSNGLMPDFSAVAANAQRRTGGWLRRTAGRVLPTEYAERFGLAQVPVEGTVGGGLGNDGVFANVTAKPTPPVRIQDGDNTYLVPEETQKDAPPSYASAQADAVPPYWETTIHAPSAPSTLGDMVIDALPTGSLFSFLWNMLVSISFQFVGFLLTYLLHTTHAAKLGSRAGFGVTLIQYGFAMRSRADEWAGEGEQAVDGWGFQSGGAQPNPTFGTAAEADDYYNNLNSTLPASIPMEPGALLGDATTEWLSFFLMTVGWFILLTSLLSFWRVKRWERGILSTTALSSSLPVPASATTPGGSLHTGTLFARLGILRTGLGFGGYPDRQIEEEDDPTAPPSEYIIPIDPNDPEGTSRLARAYADEARLHRDLRAAGLL
ncbi:hypothetical protein EW026_g418 [Hermanssonia centrifuga]|uniref:Metal homeostatis protein bsd2 n=1 Tax=Hermanssonia centrifuga TaxID=98765 RepID=A0A4S4KV45_9APHY|nr:hypothetical protein EW026_g418 [Hermanssonia centrifuga]